MFEVIPQEGWVSAQVSIPPLDRTTDNRPSVDTYAASWLALHALNRIVDAEEELEYLRVAGEGRLHQHEHSHTDHHHAAEKARTEWVLALLELTLLYRLELAFRNGPQPLGVNTELVSLRLSLQRHTSTHPHLRSMGSETSFTGSGEV